MEAAAIATADGLHVAVGAHDGRVSVLRLTDGVVVASAGVGGLIRAAVACDP